MTLVLCSIWPDLDAYTVALSSFRPLTLIHTAIVELVGSPQDQIFVRKLSILV